MLPREKGKESQGVKGQLTQAADMAGQLPEWILLPGQIPLDGLLDARQCFVSGDASHPGGCISSRRDELKIAQGAALGRLKCITMPPWRGGVNRSHRFIFPSCDCPGR
jgi:hypothetical protein